MNLESTITIFTDGSSRGNPGPGGYAAVIIFPENNNRGELKVESVKWKVAEIGGGEAHTTNNRMELTAAIEALKQIKDLRIKITVFSDSAYVINGIPKWVFGWQKNNWISSLKKPVENRDLWEKLFSVTVGKKIEWKYLGGHVGIVGNERCDEIATKFADDVKVELYSGPMEKYPIKNILDISFDASKKDEKRSSRAHSKTKAYSYVSKVDGKIVTHKTWAECEARVKGKPDAKFKKAVSAEDEKKIIALWQ